MTNRFFRTEREFSGKRVILLDQDNVLADFETGIQRAVSRIPGFPKPDRHRSSYFIQGEYHSEQAAVIEEIMASDGFFLSLEPLPGAVEAVHAIADAGHEVRICTTPVDDHRFCLADKAAWIDRHLGPAFVDKLILTRDKTLIRGHFLVDDRPDIVGALEPEWEHIVFDHRYNSRLVNHRRIFDWRNTEEWRHILFGPMPGQTPVVDAPAL